MRSHAPGAHRANLRPARGPRSAGGARHALLSVAATLLLSGVVVIVAALGQAPAAHAAQPAVGLGTATPFAVLAGSAVTNTGPSVVSGDLGLSPGSAVTGFPPGEVVGGTTHVADAVALQAKDDLTTAYNDAAGRTPVVDKTNDDLGGETLTPGVYQAATGMSLTGTVTLDAAGDPSAVFIFQAGSTLITSSSSRVALQNGAQACNVFWQVGSSATIGTTTTFVGTVMALTSITAQTGATIQGRLLARNGQVSLDTNTISRPACAPAPTGTTNPTGTATSPGTPTATSTSPGTPTGTATSTGPGTPTTPATTTTLTGPVTSTTPATPTGPGTPSTPPTTPTPPVPRTPPWVPEGPPATGREPTAPDSSDGLWLGGGLCFIGAAFGIAAVRRPRLFTRR